jgi:aryl carrier-like protein
MAKKQKEEVELKPQTEVELRLQETPQPGELTNEEKELIRGAIKLAIAKRRRGAIAVSLVTLAKHVDLLLPFSVSLETLIEYIKAEVPKDRIITTYDRIGNNTIRVEALLLYVTLEELIEEYKQRRTDSIVKVVDAGLDSIQDYKQ